MLFDQFLVCAFLCLACKCPIALVPWQSFFRTLRSPLLQHSCQLLRYHFSWRHSTRRLTQQHCPQWLFLSVYVLPCWTSWWLICKTDDLRWRRDHIWWSALEEGCTGFWVVLGWRVYWHHTKPSPIFCSSAIALFLGVRKSLLAEFYGNSPVLPIDSSSLHFCLICFIKYVI